MSLRRASAPALAFAPLSSVCGVCASVSAAVQSCSAWPLSFSAAVIATMGWSAEDASERLCRATCFCHAHPPSVARSAHSALRRREQWGQVARDASGRVQGVWRDE